MLWAWILLVVMVVGIVGVTALCLNRATEVEIQLQAPAPRRRAPPRLEEKRKFCLDCRLPVGAHHTHDQGCDRCKKAPANWYCYNDWQWFCTPCKEYHDGRHNLGEHGGKEPRLRDLAD